MKLNWARGLFLSLLIANLSSSCTSNKTASSPSSGQIEFRDDIQTKADQVFTKISVITSPIMNISTGDSSPDNWTDFQKSSHNCVSDDFYRWHDKRHFDSDSFSLVKNNPTAFELLNSMNVFSENIMPHDITPETKIGSPPMMLLEYIHDSLMIGNSTQNSQSTSILKPRPDLTINSYFVKKSKAGEFRLHDFERMRFTSQCSRFVIHHMSYGAFLSVNLKLIFANQDIKTRFLSAYGESAPFVGNYTKAQLKQMSDSLRNTNTKMQIQIAQLGGDAQATQKLLYKYHCRSTELDQCLDLTNNLFEDFFKNQLGNIQSTTLTSGWAKVGFSSKQIN